MLDRPVVAFHGVTQSGCLSLAWTVRNDIVQNGLPIEYHDGSTGFRHEFLDDEGFYTARRFICDHGIVQHPLLGDRATLISMVREPVRRMISVYYYLRERHPEYVADMEIEPWMERYGENFSQYRDFVPKDKLTESGGEKFKAAIEFLQEKVYLLGTCEEMGDFLAEVRNLLGITKFSELLVLDSGSSNPTRGKTIDPVLRQHIERCMPFDTAFYHAARALRRHLKGVEQILPTARERP